MAKTEFNISALKFEKAFDALQPTYRRGWENAKYYRGDNWNERDLKNYEKQGYKKFSIPLIAAKLNRILSLQRSNRFDWKCRGRGREDELTAEVMTYIIKYIVDETNFKWTESEICQDGLAKVYGVLKIFEDYAENPRGEVQMQKIQFDEFYWDTNSTQYNLDDATFMGESVLLPLDTVANLYPDFEWSKKGFFGGSESIYVDCHGLKKQYWYDEAKKLIRVNEHYEMRYSKKYLCKNFVTGDFEVFASDNEAKEYIQRQMQEQANIMLTQEGYSKQFSGEDFGVIPKQLKVWDKIVFSGNNEVERSEHKYYRPPYFRYSALFDDGEMWSLVDLAKDSQKAYDRLRSMIDKSIAKNIKGNNYEMLVEQLHGSETKDLDSLNRDLSAGGRVVKVTRAGTVIPLQNHNNIQVESAYAQEYQKNIEDLLGGNTFQGLENSTKQTATEVKINDENAKQTGMLFIDNEARFRNEAGKYLIEVAKRIYTPDRIVRVLGEVTSKEVLEAMKKAGIYKEPLLNRNEGGYLELNKLSKPLYDCELDIIIDDVNATASEKQKKFAQIMIYNNVEIQSGRAPLSSDIVMYYSDLDPTVKAMIIEDREKAQLALQQQQEQAGDIKKAEVLSDIISKTKPQQTNGVSVN